MGCAGARASTEPRKILRSTRKRASTKLPCVNEEIDDEEIEDDRLRLIFTCCHPALPPEGQVALTLREICGLTTEEIARAFLVTPAMLAQRIVRAKAKIRVGTIPYEVPSAAGIAGATGRGASGHVSRFLTRAICAAEAEVSGPSQPARRFDWAGCCSNSGPEPEVIGLLALMLLQESRRAARTSGAES